MESKQLPTIEEVKVLSVIQLRQVLGRCGLEKSGLKTELQERLGKYLRDKGESPAVKDAITSFKPILLRDSVTQNRGKETINVISIPSSSEDSCVEEIMNPDKEHSSCAKSGKQFSSSGNVNLIAVAETSSTSKSESDCIPVTKKGKRKKRKSDQDADKRLKEIPETPNGTLDNSIQKASAKKNRKSTVETLIHHKGKENKDTDQQKEGRILREIKVFNLAGSVTAVDLKEHFAKQGKVKGVRIMRSKCGTKKSKCGAKDLQRSFGVVRMSTVEEATWCLQKLSGSQLQGRFIQLKSASKRVRRSSDIVDQQIDLLDKNKNEKSSLAGRVPSHDTKDIDSAIALLEKELLMRKEREMCKAEPHHERKEASAVDKVAATGESAKRNKSRGCVPTKGKESSKSQHLVVKADIGQSRREPSKSFMLDKSRQRSEMCDEDFGQVSDAEQYILQEIKMAREKQDKNENSESKLWSHKHSTSEDYTSPLAVYSGDGPFLDDSLSSENGDFYGTTNPASHYFTSANSRARLDLIDDDDNNSQTSTESWRSIKEALLRNDRPIDVGSASLDDTWDGEESFPLVKEPSNIEVSAGYQPVTERSYSPLSSRVSKPKPLSDVLNNAGLNTTNDLSLSDRFEGSTCEPRTLSDVLNTAGLKTTNDLSLSDRFERPTCEKSGRRNDDDSPPPSDYTTNPTGALSREPAIAALSMLPNVPVPDLSTNGTPALRSHIRQLFAPMLGMGSGMSNPMLAGYSEALSNYDLSPAQRKQDEFICSKVGVLPLDPAEALCAGYADAMRHLGMVK